MIKTLKLFSLFFVYLSLLVLPGHAKSDKTKATWNTYYKAGEIYYRKKKDFKTANKYFYGALCKIEEMAKSKKKFSFTSNQEITLDNLFFSYMGALGAENKQRGKLLRKIGNQTLQEHRKTIIFNPGKKANSMKAIKSNYGQWKEHQINSIKQEQILLGRLLNAYKKILPANSLTLKTCQKSFTHKVQGDKELIEEYK